MNYFKTITTNTKLPASGFPAIFDMHCHIYPDNIAAKASLAIGSFYDIKAKNDGTVSALIALSEKSGITNHLIHSVSTSPSQVRSINNFIASAVAENNGKFVGFGTLHPDSGDMAGDIEHITSLGLRGVKLHPDFQEFEIDSPNALKMCNLFAGRLPLLVHAGDPRKDFSNPERIKRFCEALPELTVIAAHLGGWEQWDKAMSLLPGLPNLYVDTSSSLYALPPEQAKEIIRLYGSDRVFFGVDYPMWNPGEELERFLKIDLTREEQEDILFKNAFSLLNISV